MIKLLEVKWVDGAWVVVVAVTIGVYQVARYPLRITHIPYSNDPDLQEAVGAWGLYLLNRHVRNGSLAPHAQRVNGQRVLQHCDPSLPVYNQSWCQKIREQLPPLAVDNVSQLL